MEGPVLPVVNAVTMVKFNDRPNILLHVNQACYYNDKSQDESLVLPYQDMEHGVQFDLTSNTCKVVDGTPGKQQMIIEEV